MTDIHDEHIKRLKDNFEVKISVSPTNKHLEAGVSLMTTHNGYQWSNIAFMDRSEIEKTVAALTEYLAMG